MLLSWKLSNNVFDSGCFGCALLWGMPLMSKISAAMLWSSLISLSLAPTGSMDGFLELELLSSKSGKVDLY